jgi:ferredoxin
VHCGFCTATCPTFQLLGDELDGPRGRIYLIKEMLEGQPVSEKTQLHLDRCLSCRACETTCPSGVRYHRLLEIGREVIEQRVPRSLAARATRFLLCEALPRNWIFKPAVRVGQLLRPLLPQCSPTRCRWPAAALPDLAAAGGAPATDDRAGRLRAADADAQHQCRDGPRPRPPRHRADRGAREPPVAARCATTSMRRRKRSTTCGGSSTPGGRRSRAGASRDS